MSVVFGQVNGDTCPRCKNSLDIDGEFYEGEEFECSCGALLIIEEIEATYDLTMAVLEEPNGDKEEDSEEDKEG